MVKESSELATLVKRSRRVKPLSELKFKRSKAWSLLHARWWIGDSKWFTGGIWDTLIDLNAADAAGALAASPYLPYADQKYPQDIGISEMLLEIEKKAMEPAEFLGYLHDEEDSYVPDKVYFGSKDGKTTALNAHRVRMVGDIIGKDYAAKMSDAQSAVAFYKNGKIAAIIAPVSDKGGIDHATARDALKRHRTAKPRRSASGRPRAPARGSRRKASTGKTGRRGRPLRRPEGFYDQAGAWWREARDASPNGKVSTTQLREIARALDGRGYLPPWKYLEGEFSDALKKYNRKRSTSPIKTWVQLVECKDAVHFPGKRGMRRLLSRCGRLEPRLPLFIGL